MSRIITVMMIIAHPSECPGIQVRSATKRLYIGLYTSADIIDLNDQGADTSTSTGFSPREVFRMKRYFPGCEENIL